MPTKAKASANDLAYRALNALESLKVVLVSELTEVGGDNVESIKAVNMAFDAVIESINEFYTRVYRHNVKRPSVVPSSADTGDEGSTLTIPAARIQIANAIVIETLPPMIRKMKLDMSTRRGEALETVETLDTYQNRISRISDMVIVYIRQTLLARRRPTHTWAAISALANVVEKLI